MPARFKADIRGYIKMSCSCPNGYGCQCCDRNAQLTAEVKQKETNLALTTQRHTVSSKQIASLLDNVEDTFPDITIVFNDGTEFKAHKSILLARSPVFKAMLTSGMKESASGEISVDDPSLSSKGFKSILNFIYKCELLPFVVDPKGSELETETCVSELVYGAVKYQIEDLIKYFDETLGGSLCKEENAHFLLKLVNKFELGNARDEIVKFIMARSDLNQSVLGKLF